MPQQTNTRTAAGTILPMRFVQTGAMATNVPNAEYGVLTALQCTGAGVEILGIAQEWMNNPMGTPAQAQYVPAGYAAAVAGEEVTIYGDGSECMVVVGSGYQVTPDMLLTSDASGNAIPVGSSGAGKWIGARAIYGANGVAPPWGPGFPIRVTVVLRPYTG